MHEDIGPRSEAELKDLTETIESLLLGGPRRLTPLEVAERSGIDRELGRRMWQSMAFAAVADDEVALTDYDLHAAMRIHRAIERQIVTVDEAVSLARLAGQVFAQLAESEGETIYALAMKEASGEGFAAVAEQLAQEILPFIEEIQSYVWRRQCAAFVARRAALVSKGADASEATVGFADISGYTALSRRTAPSDLATLLEMFESVATTAVGAHNGRVVKLIGDAVLYTADDPVDGVQIGLDLLDAWPASMPPIRVGIATGSILRRLGDVFGPTVNKASRLTSLSEPGEARVDKVTRSLLTDVAGLRLDEQEPQDVRGYDQLKSWLVSRR